MPEPETGRRPPVSREPGKPSEEILTACVRAATAAPSIHNSQPWLFRIGDGTVDVLADPGRRLEAIDPSGREMLISIGAAVFNLRLALHAQGWTPETRLFPEAAEPDRVARVLAGSYAQPDESLVELAAALPHRHTNRLPFTSAMVPAPVLRALAAAAESEGAVFHVADTVARNAILDLVRTADERLRARGVRRAELAGRSRPAPRRRNALPPVAPGSWDALEVLPVRDFGLALPQLHRPAEPFPSSPTIAVLSTGTDGPGAWVRSGQALQRVLLTATTRGIATTPMSHPLEIPALREVVAGAESGRRPQVILRLGYAPPTPPTPRRPLPEVLLPAAP
ncbi:nitroreductase family protein [Streptomyces sp. MUM 2J]|uniref:Acg family FMN-binding oxidoreductase n=1 Tax=Streptomyces sp. MUM 2J TaxID=2791987 RepID=UPI001F04FF52|nr:nitroreductase family protein [Streptomyces sp. MUM 2J]MCH0565198.1 nitroreductase family protein [Streptomyces sp. MUM 2J]